MLKLFKFVVVAAIAILVAGPELRAQKPAAKRPSKPAAKQAAPAPSIAVTQIDEAGLKKLLQPNGKPLLINFWATWCDPCREEFPDLVKLDAEYKGRIDFITVSLDDPIEARRDVPKFLAEMKAAMPAYLLKAASEDTAIGQVSSEWNGALPLTVLFHPSGSRAYFRQGKVVPEVIRGEIDKLLPVHAEK